MSEAEKEANELIEKFRPYAFNDNTYNHMRNCYEVDISAKQCALVCVDKMIETLKMSAPFISTKNDVSYFKIMDYYKEVKQIINNK